MRSCPHCDGKGSLPDPEPTPRFVRVVQIVELSIFGLALLSSALPQSIRVALAPPRWLFMTILLVFAWGLPVAAWDDDPDRCAHDRMSLRARIIFGTVLSGIFAAIWIEAALQERGH